MSKRNIISKTEEILKEILIDKDIFLVEVDYTKENNIYYLKVFIDTDEGITIDECSDVSRALSKKLDDLDFIEDSYFLEISSPGIDRPFKSLEDYEKNINEKIELNLYAKKDNKKVFVGKLTDIDNEIITIQLDDESGKEMVFKMNEIAKANKYIEF